MTSNPAPLEYVFTLDDALCRSELGGGASDLTFTMDRHAGSWPREADAIANSFNNRVHRVKPRGPSDKNSGRVHLEPGRMEVDLPILSDDWVRGGPAGFLLEWREAEGGTPAVMEGTFVGDFRGTPVRGRLRVERRVPWRQPTTPYPETPAVLRAWERDGWRSPLADFSYAGYDRGATPPPRVAGPVFRAVEYGLRPDSGADALPAIQKAIDAAGRAGGGVVLLPPGRLDLNLHGKGPCIEIARDNIVLRGAGSGGPVAGGTEIVNHAASESPVWNQPWRAGEQPGQIHVGHVPAKDMGGYGAQPEARLCAVQPSERGALSILVDDPRGLAVGGTYLLRQMEDAAGSLGRSLIEPARFLGGNYLGEGTPLVEQYVTIRAIDGRRLHLDAPLHWPTRPSWRPALWRTRILRGVGIEHLRLRSQWQGFFDHHRNGEHDNGWDHIRVDSLVDGWVRDVVHDSCTTAVSLKGCKNVTVMDNRIVGNPAHNGFGAGPATTNCLFLRCHGAQQMHAFALHTRPTGTVYLDCHADEASGIDLHGGIGVDNLYDGLTGCVNVGGGSPTATPPRNGFGFVLWNWAMGRFNPYCKHREHDEITQWHQTPRFVAVGCHGRLGQPIHVRGPRGIVAEDIHADWGIVEGLNRRVEPASLYLYQRARRLGPDAPPL